MARTRSVLALCSLSLCVCLAVLPTVRADDVKIIATGFTWAENLRCDAATGALFVSEYRRGELYKVCALC